MKPKADDGAAPAKVATIVKTEKVPRKQRARSTPVGQRGLVFPEIRSKKKPDLIKDGWFGLLSSMDDGWLSHNSRVSDDVSLAKGRPQRCARTSGWHNRMFHQGRTATVEDLKNFRKQMHERVLDGVALKTGRKGSTVAGSIVSGFDRVMKNDMREPFVYPGIMQINPAPFKNAAGRPCDSISDGKTIRPSSCPESKQVRRRSRSQSVTPPAGQRPPVREYPRPRSVSYCLGRGGQRVRS